jgi:integrase
MTGACCRPCMVDGSRRPKRQRGSIRRLKSGSLQVRVYAGVDPVTKKDLYLTAVIPPGPRQEKQAEKARTRLLSQVDEKRNPKTRATVAQLMTGYFSVLDADTQTVRGYRSKYETHIKPLLGTTQLSRLDVETLDTF